MAFFEKDGDRLVRKVPFPKGELSLDVHKENNGKLRRLDIEYPTAHYHFSDAFKTQREAKEFGITFVYGFDAGLACGDEVHIKNEN